MECYNYENPRPGYIWILRKLVKIYGPIILLIVFIVKFICSNSTNLNIFNISDTANIHQALGIDIHTKNGSLPKNYILCSQIGLGRVRFTKDTIFSESKIAKDSNISSFKSHPNIPLFLIESTKISSLMPDIHEIRWTGVVWQESWRNYPKFLLYSAHFDSRGYKCSKNKGCTNRYVRILGLYDGIYEPTTYSCQFWYNETDPPVLTSVQSYDIIDWQGFSSDKLIPYMISCAVPEIENEFRTPIAVSLVNNSCLSPSSILKITGVSADLNASLKSNGRKDLAVGVCGPALYYYNEDFSQRLIEWIELMYAIGASQIIFYETVNHKNVEKVLRYYEDVGKIKTISFHYPPPYADDPSLRRPWTFKERKQLFALENIYFTDCILRFKDNFQYLAHFDPDEVPILKNHKTLGHLLRYLRKSGPKHHKPAFYHLKWKTFYPDTPLDNAALNLSKRFYLLSHTKRPKNFVKKIDYNGKSIYDTSNVLAVYSHKPLLYIDRRKFAKKEFTVDPSVAYTAHFRSSPCGESCKNIKMVEEPFLLQFKDKIIKEADSVLERLNMKVIDD